MLYKTHNLPTDEMANLPEPRLTLSPGQIAVMGTIAVQAALTMDWYSDANLSPVEQQDPANKFFFPESIRLFF